ncbi:MAG: NHL repeat-containing protein, partial [Myxococcales bacterium]|nr:NHL repeat-containing protein [Myxococcales bacterium]
GAGGTSGAAGSAGAGGSAGSGTTGGTGGTSAGGTGGTGTGGTGGGPSCTWPGLPAGGVTLPGNSPEGVAFSNDCALLVVESDTVYRIDPATPSVATAFATQTGVTDLQDVEVASDGTLYVTSRGANSVVRFDGTTGAFIDTFATTTFNLPNSMVFDPSGNLYVSSRNTGNVVRFSPSGTDLGVFATTAQLGSPEGMVFGPGGELFVSGRTNSVVQRFNSSGTFVSTVIQTPAVSAPEGLAFTSDGRMWVNSRDTAEVVRLNSTTFAEIDRVAFTNEQPIGMVVAPNGDVIISLRGSGRITTVP